MTESHGQTTRLFSPAGVTWLGVAANALLGVSKVVVGLLLSSQALVADGVHGASDLVTDFMVLAGLRASARPADDDHPYGHSRIGTLVAMFVGLALTATAAWIMYGAVSNIHRPDRDIRPLAPLILAAASVPLKEMLFRVTRRVARRSGNVMLRANAWHHRSDAATSLAATLGLAGVLIGGEDWRVLDPITAVVLAAFLLIVGYRIFAASAAELTDRAPSKDVMESIHQVVGGTEGVRGFHAVRARQVGGRVEMDIHVQVDPELTVIQGHEIASKVKYRILACPCDVTEVIVHLEPDESQQDRRP